MSLTAAVNGVSKLNAARMNQGIKLHPFRLICEGTQIAAKTGAGVVENSLADYNYMARIAIAGTRIDRIELEVDLDGTGADLEVELRSGAFNPDGSNDGVLITSVLAPKEFLPNPKAWFSIPFAARALTAGNYWVLIKRSGDATNKVDLIGEVSTDGAYPVYRRAGSSGAWTATNAIHIKAFAGSSDKIMHETEGGATTWNTLDGNNLTTKIQLYIPPEGGVGLGVRETMTFSWDGNFEEGGDVN